MKCSPFLIVISILLQLVYFGNAFRNYNRVVLDDIGDDIILTKLSMENTKDSGRIKANKYSHNGFINPQLIQRNIGVMHRNKLREVDDELQGKDDLFRFKGVSTKHLRRTVNPNVPNDDNIMQDKKSLSNGLILYYGKRTANTKTE